MSTVVEILKVVAKLLIPVVKDSVTKDMKCSNCGYEMSYKEAYPAIVNHVGKSNIVSSSIGVPQLLANKTKLPCPKFGEKKCWGDA